MYLYTLLKVVSYDLSVLSMGFQKKFGWGGWVGRAQVFFMDFWNLFNFAKPLSLC